MQVSVVTTAVLISVLAAWLACARIRRNVQRSRLELATAAVLAERRRLAREIHDGMAQDLAFIVQQAESLDGGDGTAEGLAQIATAARRALDESRVAIGDLMRPAGEPLADALSRVADEASGRWGASTETHTAPGLELSPPRREALLRIAGEAVTNAARHARSRRIVVELGEHPVLQLRVRDDGVGFDPASTEGLGGHHGITGMRARAEQLGGRLRIASSPGQGTEVVVSLP